MKDTRTVINGETETKVNFTGRKWSLILDKGRMIFLYYSEVGKVSKQKELSGKSRSCLVDLGTSVCVRVACQRRMLQREQAHGLSSHHLRTLGHLGVSLLAKSV